MAPLGPRYPSLQAPLQMGSLELSNRIAMASLTRNRAPNNVPGDDVVEYYRQRSNAGLILTEGVFICPLGSEWDHVPGIYTDEQVQGWKKVTDAVHGAGGKIFAQLWHIGRVAHPQLQGGKPNLGPSAVCAAGGKFPQLPGQTGYVTPQAIDDPRTIIELYKEAAVRAKAAGFDGVELHSANGYLPHQFLEPHSNQRNDSYGGSVENRCRFALEAIDELVAVWGDAKRVGIKLSPSGGYNDMGPSNKKELAAAVQLYSHLIRELDSRGIGYVQMGRRLSALGWLHNGKLGFSQLPTLFKNIAFMVRSKPPTDSMKRGMPVDIQTFRPLCKNTLFFVNGNYTAEEANKAVASGKADAVVIGRPFITNPDYALRVFKGLPINTDYDVASYYAVPQGRPNSYHYSDYPAAA